MALALTVIAALGCGASGGKGAPCGTDQDCPGGLCIDGTCRPRAGDCGAACDASCTGDGCGSDADAALDGEDAPLDGPLDTPEASVDADATDAPSCTSGAAEACYTGPAGTADVGRCRAGTRTCTDGGWGGCEGEVVPTAEIPDNVVDDDCDGEVDEGSPPCAVGSSRDCYTGSPATEDVGLCAGGTQTCSDVGGTHTWGACEGQILPEPSDAAGDGEDDDCDGLTDESDSTSPAAAWTGTGYGVVYADLTAAGRETYLIVVGGDGVVTAGPIHLNDSPSGNNAGAYNAIVWNAADAEFGVVWHHEATGGAPSTIEFRRVGADGSVLSSQTTLVESVCGATELLWTGVQYAAIFAAANWEPPSLVTIGTVGSPSVSELAVTTGAACAHLSLAWTGAGGGFGVLWSARDPISSQYSLDVATVTAGGAVLSEGQIHSASSGDPTRGAYDGARLAWTGDGFTTIYVHAGATYGARLDTGGTLATTATLAPAARELSPILYDPGASVVRGLWVGTSLSAFRVSIALTLAELAITPATEPHRPGLALAAGASGLVFEGRVTADDREVLFAVASDVALTTAPTRISPD